MTPRQNLRLALRDLNRPKPTHYVEHVNEGRARPYRNYRPHYARSRGRQPNVAAELTIVVWMVAVAVLTYTMFYIY